MPVQINFLQHGLGLEFISSEILTGKDIIEANKKVYTPENLAKLKYKVIDRSACKEYQITPEEIQAIARQEIAASKHNKNITIILIAANDHQYGMTRMWQVHTEPAGFKTIIFRDKESAYKYVREHFADS